MGQNEEPLLWVPVLPVDLYPRSLLLLIVFLREYTMAGAQKMLLILAT
jgi:hypothetical protein